MVEQIDPVRQGRTHGEQVDQAAPDAEFAGGADLCDMAVVGQGQLRPQPFFVQRIILAKLKGIGRQEFRRRQAYQGGRDRNDQHVHDALSQGMQGAQALGNQILVG